MIEKTQIINKLESQPDNVFIEQVNDHLFFLDKVRKGLDDLENGRINTVEEAREKLKKWL